MRIAALCLMALFYGCYFAKMLSQARKGIQTDQMGKGKQGSVRTIEILLKISTILSVAAELFSIGLNTTPLPNWARITGAVITAFGVLLFWLSVLTMKDSWRAGVPEQDETEFVTRGVFQLSRNPAFLGFDLTYLGLLLMFFNPWHCAAAVLSAVMMHLQITRVEEPFLRQRFGEPYIQYCKKVCRYLGRKI